MHIERSQDDVSHLDQAINVDQCHDETVRATFCVLVYSIVTYYCQMTLAGVITVAPFQIAQNRYSGHIRGLKLRHKMLLYIGLIQNITYEMILF